MANLSQIKRNRMKAFLETLKKSNDGDDQIFGLPGKKSSWRERFTS